MMKREGLVYLTCRRMNTRLDFCPQTLDLTNSPDVFHLRHTIMKLFEGPKEMSQRISRVEQREQYL